MREGERESAEESERESGRERAPWRRTCESGLPQPPPPKKKTAPGAKDTVEPNRGRKGHGGYVTRFQKWSGPQHVSSGAGLTKDLQQLVIQFQEIRVAPRDFPPPSL